LTTDDIEPMLTVMYVSRTDLLKRFAGGDRCFATVEDGKIVNYFWVTFNARQSQELNLKFRLAGDQAWLYNAITIKAARGRGLYPNIVRHIAKMLRQSGFTEAFIEVEQKNTASLRGLEKARCSRVALITWRRVFTRTFYRITVFDYVTWQRLSENIEAYSSLNKRVRPVYES
jgi:GNAT superfamily N-acetyltransferase